MSKRFKVLMVGFFITFFVFDVFYAYTEYKKGHQPTEHSYSFYSTGEVTIAPAKEHHLIDDSNLQEMYKEYNKTYFGDKLLHNPDIKFEQTAENVEGFFNNFSFEIRLSPSVQDNPRELRVDLLHEMAHEYVRLIFATNPTVWNHGDKWKAEMRHLALIGAFDAQLWNEEEK